MTNTDRPAFGFHPTSGIVGSCAFTYSAASLVVALFVLFTLASLAFTLALSPFFGNARVAALAGPLLFFVTAMLYFLFLASATGLQPATPHPAAVAAASLPPVPIPAAAC